MSTVFSSNLEPSCGVVFSNIFSLIRNMTTFKRPPSPQIRLSEVSGVEVADRRGYLTLELETGKDGVLLLRYLPTVSTIYQWPNQMDDYSPTDSNCSIDWRHKGWIAPWLQTRSLLTNDSFHKTMPPRTEPEDATFPRSKNWSICCGRVFYGSIHPGLLMPKKLFLRLALHFAAISLADSKPLNH